MHSRARRWPVVAVLAAALPLLAACGSSDKKSSTSSASSTAAAGKFDCKGGAVTIGIAKALTGVLALFDGNERNGAVLAISDVNKAGGIDGCKLKYVQGDTKSDPAVGGQVATDLINKGAQVLLVPGDFDLGVTAAQAAQKAGIVSMSPGASSTVFTKAVGPLFFEAGLTTDDLGKGQARFANDKGWKTVYVVANKDFDFFTSQAKVFQSNFGGKVVGNDVVTSDQQDYSGVVSKIAQVKPAPDVVFGSTFFPNVGAFIKQLRQAGVKSAVLGSPAYSSRDLPKVVGKGNVKDVFYVSSVYFEGAGADPAVTKVADEYQAMFHKPPDAHNAFLGYQGVMALVDGLKKAGTADPAKLAAAIKGQTNIQAAGSTILDWQNNTAHRAVVVVGFDGSGNFTKVTELGD
jgi:branched-chain amino acid transport system substrate-binding protein